MWGGGEQENLCVCVPVPAIYLHIFFFSEFQGHAVATWHLIGEEESARGFLLAGIEGRTTLSQKQGWAGQLPCGGQQSRGSGAS